MKRVKQSKVGFLRCSRVSRLRRECGNREPSEVLRKGAAFDGPFPWRGLEGVTSKALVEELAFEGTGKVPFRERRCGSPIGDLNYRENR